MEDWQGLKTESGDVADLTPHAGDDPPALGTTPFEWGEDDEDQDRNIRPVNTPDNPAHRIIRPAQTG